MSWQERDGATFINVQDYDQGLIHSHATLPDGEFRRMTGAFTVTRPADRTSDERPHRNKALGGEGRAKLVLQTSIHSNATSLFYRLRY